jgi:proteasome accessory factor A
MGASLFGLEAELAVSARKNGASVPVADLVEALADVARRELTHLRGGGSRMFLANGALFYIDAGHHPEVATPECTTPWQAVSHLRSVERMVAGLAARVREELNLDEILVNRCNVDYVCGATWGCHESLMTRRPIGDFERWLIPHLASRILYTGSGGLDPLSPGIRFSVSPRVAHIDRVISGESTSNRGIFHTRDESLSSRYHRLHILVGDNACSQLAQLLKIGTTALVVALVEGHPEDAPLRIRNPLTALKGFARDVRFRAEVQTPHGSQMMSALDIQHDYLARIEACANTGLLPDWSARICELWRAALEAVGRNDGRGVQSLDWPLKRDLIERELASSGFAQEAVDSWSDVLEELNGYWLATGERDVTMDAKKIGELRASCRGNWIIVDQAGVALAARGLEWDGLDAFNALRRRLCEIDVRFGLVNDGIFDALDRHGMLPAHRVVSDEDIGTAAELAPAETRANLRAHWVRRLASDPARYVCSWEGIRGNKNYLDLGDPFATEGKWKATNVPLGADEDELFAAVRSRRRA